MTDDRSRALAGAVKPDSKTDAGGVPDTRELARKAALFREGTKRIYEGQGDRADMWFFELFHFLGDVQVALTAPARSDAVTREVLIHTICPHIKQWCDGEDAPDTTCPQCTATVQTSQGIGVQMCRLNAEKAADAVLALYPTPAVKP